MEQFMAQFDESDAESEDIIDQAIDEGKKGDPSSLIAVEAVCEMLEDGKWDVGKLDAAFVDSLAKKVTKAWMKMNAAFESKPECLKEGRYDGVKEVVSSVFGPDTYAPVFLAMQLVVGHGTQLLNELGLRNLFASDDAVNQMVVNIIGMLHCFDMDCFRIFDNNPAIISTVFSSLLVSRRLPQ